MWPREHGAYAQLGAPLLTALAVAAPTTPAIALAIAACLAFLANEPLMIVLGHRGPRMHAASGPAARLRLGITAGGAAISAGVGLALAPPHALALAAFVAIPVLATIGLAWTKSVHSVAGELVAAAALPGAAAPVAAASGVPWQTAALLWLAWSLGYAASVVAVHEILRRQRRVAPRLLLAIAAAAVAVSAVWVRALWVAVPLVGLSAGLGVRPPSARRVRTIGVALVIASTASVAIAVVLAS